MTQNELELLIILEAGSGICRVDLPGNDWRVFLLGAWSPIQSNRLRAKRQHVAMRVNERQIRGRRGKKRIAKAVAALALISN